MTKSETDLNQGYISAINGSLIEVKGLENEVKLHDLVKISNFNILGEVIQIYNDYVVAQCFENTTNLRLREKVTNQKAPLSMELAPGLLSNIFDGILRPLDVAFKKIENGGFLERGIEIKSLSRTKKWHFVPEKEVGDKVSSGDIIGTIQETDLIEHRIFIPPNNSGALSFIAEEGDYTIVEDIYKIRNDDNDEKAFQMLQKWPVIRNRPYKRKFRPEDPLITGLRVIDLLFPVAKGGTVAVPGGFGTGKTIIQQSLAKWCKADVIVFVGCGERGNEIADILKQFAEIKDPKTNLPLLERIVLIANTSNMPVSAREASIFSGVTIAEYYRDMGYDVALLADSTSRWAESLREISGLLEEMPAEEGYPAYLPSKLSSFYERAGIVELLGSESGEKRMGSLTIIGSVSPPSGDFSEPVTSNTKRFVQAFWALDAELAYSKHYPAVNWRDSYSNYPEYISDWWFECEDEDTDWSELELDWFECRNQFNNILSTESNLKNITQLLGEENLPEDQQLVLFIAKVIKDGFLIQNAFDEIDCYTSPKKLLGLAKLILLFYNEAKKLLKQGILIEDLKDLDIIDEILRVKNSIPNNEFDQILDLKSKLLDELDSLKSMFGVLKKI
ncbi:MAG: V-type ATP synthase subunit A [Candidatus Lokiarchaeota archaeon]|nr:V-type ATP synthase subunit A [Candidatus Lokiarchaeota archaeon]MBD3339261.1 V-type ATP synthase subunit A [Candidatus Lokiarchaeota archaeon]